MTKEAQPTPLDNGVWQSTSNPVLNRSHSICGGRYGDGNISGTMPAFRSGTDLISLLILFFFFLLGQPSSALGSIVLHWIGMKFGRIAPRVNTHQLTKSYFCLLYTSPSPRD